MEPLPTTSVSDQQFDARKKPAAYILVFGWIPALLVLLQRGIAPPIGILEVMGLEITIGLAFWWLKHRRRSGIIAGLWTYFFLRILVFIGADFPEAEEMIAVYLMLVAVIACVFFLLHRVKILRNIIAGCIAIMGLGALIGGLKYENIHHRLPTEVMRECAKGVKQRSMEIDPENEKLDSITAHLQAEKDIKKQAAHFDLLADYSRIRFQRITTILSLLDSATTELKKEITPPKKEQQIINNYAQFYKMAAGLGQDEQLLIDTLEQWYHSPAVQMNAATIAHYTDSLIGIQTQILLALDNAKSRRWSFFAYTE